MMIWSSPEATDSSTTYWMAGLSTSGSISLGWALVAGRNRVPRPATGNTALRTMDVTLTIVAEARPAREYTMKTEAPVLDSNYIRDHLEAVRTGLRNRGLDPDKALEQIGTLETVRRRVIPELEALKRQQNTSGDEIARAKRQGLDTTPIQEANRSRAQQIKQLSIQLDAIDYQRTQALMTLPNLLHESVPIGTSAADNREVRRHGEPRALDFEPQPHWDLGPALGILDFERAVK